MNLIHEDQARSHPWRRWRGNQPAPGGVVARETERALAARVALAQLLYGGHGR